MTLPLSKEQIEAIQAFLETEYPHAGLKPLCQQALRAIELEAEKREFIAGALQMINAEHCGGDQWWRGYDMLKQAIIDQNVDCSAPWLREPTASSKASYHERLQSELTAARNALEEERERCAKVADIEYNEQSRLATFHRTEGNEDAMDRRNAAARAASNVASNIRALPSPQVKG